MNANADPGAKSDEHPPSDGPAGIPAGGANVPRDHIFDSNAVTENVGERLEQLEVDALKESLAHWLAEREKYRSGERSMANFYSAWWCSKIASGIQRELDARRPGPSRAMRPRPRRRIGRPVSRVDDNRR